MINEHENIEALEIISDLLTFINYLTNISHKVSESKICSEYKKDILIELHESINKTYCERIDSYLYPLMCRLDKRPIEPTEGI